MWLNAFKWFLQIMTCKKCGILEENCAAVQVSTSSGFWLLTATELYTLLNRFVKTIYKFIYYRIFICLLKKDEIEVFIFKSDKHMATTAILQQILLPATNNNLHPAATPTSNTGPNWPHSIASLYNILPTQYTASTKIYLPIRLPATSPVKPLLS